MNRPFHFLLYLQASGGLESSGGLQLSQGGFYDRDKETKSENKSTFRMSLVMVIFPDNNFHNCSAVIALSPSTGNMFFVTQTCKQMMARLCVRIFGLVEMQWTILTAEIHLPSRTEKLLFLAE